ncbi:MAG: chemotaxis protein CheB [Pseudomonadota bacterium]
MAAQIRSPQLVVRPVLRDVVVVGASAGGVSALCSMAAKLPASFAPSVFVVVHIGSHPSALPDILTASGPLPAKHPSDGDRYLPGVIYVAPPDCHMLLQDGLIRLTHGPKEHHTRPAIDPLFRSAALSVGPRAIGVVLTGHLDDGTAGMQAIKECGGLTVVQDPAEAEASGMPESVLESVDIDHCVRLSDLADTLVQLSKHPVVANVVQAPPRLVNEHLASTSKGLILDKLESVAQPSSLVCPECTGTLWEITDSRPPRYRCHTGHAYSLQSLAHNQSVSVEAALWSALRALQDREVILRKMAELHRQSGDESQALEVQAEADLVCQHGILIQQLVESKSLLAQ